MSKTFNIPSGKLLNPVTSDLKPIYFSQQDAFTCLYDAYVDRIYRYIYFRVADDDLAENMTSQVFLEAWEQLPTYQTGKSPIISWLYSIAYNTVINHGHINGTSVAGDEANPVDDGMGLQIKSQPLHEALQELADKQQQVLILKFICGFSALGTAQQFEKQQGAARSLQMRGIDELIEHPALQIEQMYQQ